MNQHTAMVLHDSVCNSVTGAASFPQIVAALAGAGVERYHADYSRHEKTFYLADGDSLVVTMPCEAFPTGEVFSPELVESAVRASQRNEHTYTDFVRKTMAAGCVGYFVQITGRRAMYFGRNGEVHMEWFPGAGSQVAP